MNELDHAYQMLWAKIFELVFRIAAFGEWGAVQNNYLPIPSNSGALGGAKRYKYIAVSLSKNNRAVFVLKDDGPLGSEKLIIGVKEVTSPEDTVFRVTGEEIFRSLRSLLEGITRRYENTQQKDLSEAARILKLIEQG